MNTDGEQYRENTDGSMNGAQSFGDFGRGGTAYTDHAGNTPYVGGPSSGTYAAPDEYERSNPITANHGSYGGGYGSAYTQWKNPNAPYEYQPPTQTGSFDRQAQTSSADAVFSSRGRALTAVRQGGFRKKVFLKKDSVMWNYYKEYLSLDISDSSSIASTSYPEFIENRIDIIKNREYAMGEIEVPLIMQKWKETFELLQKDLEAK